MRLTNKIILLASLLTLALNIAAKDELKGKAILIKSDSSISNSSSIYSEKNLYSKYSNWGIWPEKKGALDLREVWKNFTKRKDVIVAIIDTGIDPNHEYIKNNLFTFEGNITDGNFGMDFSETITSTTPYDNHGHGTHVAGIIKSIFPEVKLLALKYYNPKASGQKNLEATLRALKYAIDKNVDFINYSGGGPEPSAEELSLIKKAEAKGIMIIAAAGNERSDIDNKRNAYYPASYGLSNIVTVSAYDEKGDKIESANWGSKSVDFSAPGYRINSSIPGNRNGQMTGTSQATAFGTGVAALIKAQYPTISMRDLKNIMVGSTESSISLKGKSRTGGFLSPKRAFAFIKDKIARVAESRNSESTRKIAEDKAKKVN